MTTSLETMQNRDFPVPNDELGRNVERAEQVEALARHGPRENIPANDAPVHVLAANFLEDRSE